MNKQLWSIPVPATALVKGPFLNVLLKRQVEIVFSIEAEDGGEKQMSLFFDGVESFRATHLFSLATVNSELRKQAYGSVICVKSSTWLKEVSNAYSNYCSMAGQPTKELQHLMICFDDGPCYEFICSGFTHK